MFIGKWNKSIIVTYIGVAISILGMYFAITGYINYSFICLIISGICDLFDGKFARMCKRTDEEKRFGIQLDSLADVVNFIVFPIVIFISLGFTNLWNIVIYICFAICGIQRLAHFNTVTQENQSTKYYRGLPVTYTALILPCIYLLSYIINDSIFNVMYGLLMFLIAILNILNFKNKKPTGIWYLIFSVLAIGVIIMYMVVL